MGLRAFVKRKILCRKPRVLLYVDPTNGDVYDQRVELVREACAVHQTQLVCVWSRSFSRMLLNRVETDNEYAAEIRSMLAPEEGEELAWAAEHLRAGCEVVGVISGSDAGMGTSERLLDALGAPGRSNGRLSARRDKFEMHEALKVVGLASARQCVASEWSVAQVFLVTLPEPLAAVLKPRRGSNSLRVGLTNSELHARALFTDILANPSSLDDESDDASVLLCKNFWAVPRPRSGWSTRSREMASTASQRCGGTTRARPTERRSSTLAKSRWAAARHRHSVLPPMRVQSLTRWRGAGARHTSR